MLRHHLLALIVGLMGGLLQWGPTAIAADYIIHSGDVIEIAVSGAPSLSRRGAVNDDGQIFFPAIGSIQAAGLSAAQLRQRLGELLAAKDVIRNPEVMVEIVSYRPVYVQGDVVSPGVYPYRPGLTVNDAVFMADSLGVVQLRDRVYIGEATNARSEVGRLSVEVVTQAARIARLQAGLAGESEVDVKPVPAGLVTPTTLSEIIAVQTQQLKAEQEAYANKKVHVERMFETTRDQITYLRQAQQMGEREVEQLQKDAARAHELLQKGLVQMTRIEEQQRAISAAHFRLSDVLARATAAQKALEAENRELEEFNEKLKIERLGKLEEAVSKFAAARLELDAANEKLRLAGIMQRPNAFRGGRDGRRFVILRRGQDGHQQRDVVSQDAEVFPGDVIEVSATSPGVPPGAATVEGPRSR